MSAPGIDEFVVARFWLKVDRRDGDACWNWRASKCKKGYGWSTYAGAGRTRVGRAHRFSFALANGRHPVLSVLHSCDNPSCVNPLHLREGTAADNSDDASRRGRFRTILDAETVRSMRELYAGGASVASIARGVGRPWNTVKKALSGLTWKHVP